MSDQECAAEDDDDPQMGNDEEEEEPTPTLKMTDPPVYIPYNRQTYHVPVSVDGSCGVVRNHPDHVCVVPDGETLQLLRSSNIEEWTNLRDSGRLDYKEATVIKGRQKAGEAPRNGFYAAAKSEDAEAGCQDHLVHMSMPKATYKEFKEALFEDDSMKGSRLRDLCNDEKQNAKPLDPEASGFVKMPADFKLKTAAKKKPPEKKTDKGDKATKKKPPPEDYFKPRTAESASSSEATEAKETPKEAPKETKKDAAKKKKEEPKEAKETPKETPKETEAPKAKEKPKEKAKTDPPAAKAPKRRLYEMVELHDGLVEDDMNEIVFKIPKSFQALQWKASITWTAAP